MRTYYISLAICLLFSIAAISQTDKNNPSLSAPAKGYYAIGDNHTKLPGRAVITFDSVAAPAASKGFYALKGSNQKSGRKLLLINQKPTKQVVTKGYYAIGRNAEKLNN